MTHGGRRPGAGRPKGKRYLAGSFLTEQPNKPAQAPVLPVSQLRPTAGEVAAARRKLLALPSESRTRTTRQKFGLSRIDVFKQCLAHPKVREKMARDYPYLLDRYELFAQRHLTLEEMSAALKQSKAVLEIMLADFERDAIKHALFFGVKLAPKERDENETDFERALDEDAAAQNSELAGGGERMSTVGQGYRERKDGLHDRPLDSFDFKRDFTRDDADEGSGEQEGGGPDYDDYSDESHA